MNNDRHLTVLTLDSEIKVAVLYDHEPAEPRTHDYKGYDENVDIIKIYAPKGENVYELINALGMVDYFAEKVLEKIKE